MVEFNPELEARVQVFQDRLVVPARGASFTVLPAVAKSLEGLDPTLAIVDEAGRVDREVFEVISLASGKREHSTTLAIGTPGPLLDESVLGLLRIYGMEHPDDSSFVWREHSAAGFEDHPVELPALLEARESRNGRLLVREWAAGGVAAEDARSDVPQGALVSVGRYAG